MGSSRHGFLCSKIVLLDTEETKEKKLQKYAKNAKKKKSSKIKKKVVFGEFSRYFALKNSSVF